MPSALLRLDRQSGSAQVVEFSWVFPVAALVVVALLYLSFLLFFYVYSFHLAEWYADESLHVAQSREMEDNVEPELREQIRKLSFLPGVHFRPEVRTGKQGKKIEVKISCSYLGKQMFCVKAERKMLSPVEYAQAVDFAKFVKRMC